MLRADFFLRPKLAFALHRLESVCIESRNISNSVRTALIFSASPVGCGGVIARRQHLDAENTMSDKYPVPPVQVCAEDARHMVGGISHRLLWQLTADGAIPHNKINRRTFYPIAGLNAWVAAGCPTEPGSAASLKWEGDAK